MLNRKDKEKFPTVILWLKKKIGWTANAATELTEFLAMPVL